MSFFFFVFFFWGGGGSIPSIGKQKQKRSRQRKQKKNSRLGINCIVKKKYYLKTVFSRLQAVARCLIVKSKIIVVIPPSSNDPKSSLPSRRSPTADLRGNLSKQSVPSKSQNSDCRPPTTDRAQSKSLAYPRRKLDSKQATAERHPQNFKATQD